MADNLALPDSTQTDATGKEIGAIPKPVESGDGLPVNGPTTPGIGRGITTNTLLNFSKENLAHNCDVVFPMNKDLATARLEVMAFVGSLRTSIEALFAGTSTNPVVEDITAEIKDIQAKIKLLQKEAQPIIDQAKAIQEYAKQLQALIVEIQSLPANLQKLLASCLGEATSSLASLQKSVTGTPQEILAAATSQVKDIQNQVTATTTQVSSTLTIPK